MIDAFFGVDDCRETSRNRAEYVNKLKSRLQFAYRTAAEEAGIISIMKDVRENKLEEGDDVLIKKVGFEGQHKLLVFMGDIKSILHRKKSNCLFLPCLNVKKKINLFQSVSRHHRKLTFFLVITRQFCGVQRFYWV